VNLDLHEGRGAGVATPHRVYPRIAELYRSISASACGGRQVCHPVLHTKADQLRVSLLQGL
jgi:hypothetical protein